MQRWEPHRRTLFGVKLDPSGGDPSTVREVLNVDENDDENDDDDNDDKKGVPTLQNTTKI